MRFVYERGTEAEREAVRRRLGELMQPEAALGLVRRVSGHVVPVQARCAAVREGKDRYVIRVETRTADGAARAYALKGYADERGALIGSLYERLGRYWLQRGQWSPVIEPLCYLPEERLFVLPWIAGVSLAEAVEAGRAELIRHAIDHVPQTLARLHATPIVPEPPTGPAAMVALAMEHWERDYPRRFREARRSVIEPLMQALEGAAARLAPARPTLVHGDTGPGNFLRDGECWRLLDLDTYGYADPAYDVGYLLAKLENQCLAQPALRPQADELVSAMRRACLDAMPGLSARNVGFYYAVTLTRKTLAQVMRALPREQLGEFQQAAAPIVKRIRDAVEEAVPQ